MTNEDKKFLDLTMELLVCNYHEKHHKFTQAKRNDLARVFKHFRIHLLDDTLQIETFYFSGSGPAVVLTRMYVHPVTKEHRVWSRSIYVNPSIDKVNTSVLKCTPEVVKFVTKRFNREKLSNPIQRESETAYP